MTCDSRGLISWTEARDRLRAAADALSPVAVSVVDAPGLRLAEAVVAEFDLPADDVSVMDGYAGRCAEMGGAPLTIAAEARAGMPRLDLPRDAVIRVQTGAVIPQGADCVVAQEQATIASNLGVLLPAARPDQFIRHRGEVCQAGQIIAELGQVVSPQLAGLLLAAGPQAVRVFPRPRMAILTTGSELIGPKDSPGFGKVRDSNACMLRSLALNAGLPPTLYARIRDNREAMRTNMQEAVRHVDIVVTTGGISVGDYDHIRETIESLGAQILFHGVSIRPGKPTLAARLGGAWIVGLPGNPLSALVGWHLFVHPMIEFLAGDPAAFAARPRTASLAKAVANPGDRVTFLPLRLADREQDLGADPVVWRGSHDLLAISRANALGVLAPGSRFAAGDKIPIVGLSTGLRRH